MADDRKNEIEPLVVAVWPDAGRALGYRSRSATYSAVARGVIPVIKLGRLQRVSRTWLAKKTAGEIEAA